MPEAAQAGVLSQLEAHAQQTSLALEQALGLAESVRRLAEKARLQQLAAPLPALVLKASRPPQVPQAADRLCPDVHLAGAVGKAAVEAARLANWVGKCSSLATSSRAAWEELQVGCRQAGVSDQRARLWAATQKASRQTRLIQGCTL